MWSNASGSAAAPPPPAAASSHSSGSVYGEPAADVGASAMAAAPTDMMIALIIGMSSRAGTASRNRENRRSQYGRAESTRNTGRAAMTMWTNMSVIIPNSMVRIRTWIATSAFVRPSIKFVSVPVAPDIMSNDCPSIHDVSTASVALSEGMPNSSRSWLTSVLRSICPNT